MGEVGRLVPERILEITGIEYPSPSDASLPELKALEY